MKLPRDAASAPGRCAPASLCKEAGRIPMPNPRSVAGLLINEGIFGGFSGEPDQEVVDRLLRRFSDATNALKGSCIGETTSFLLQPISFATSPKR